ncbi:TSUP family transporter [Enterobacter hormaechei]
MAYTIYGLLTKKEAERVENAQIRWFKTSTTTGGSLVGFISSFIGIAGGTITIPLLSHWGFNTRKCIATSSMLGVIIATIGTVMGIVHGWQQTELADYYLGFVYLPAFIGISITSILTALSA